MKKLISIILALTMMLALTLPVLAVENAMDSFICPACGGTAYEDYKISSSNIYTTCSHTPTSSSISHLHVKYYRQYVAICEDCTNTIVLGSKEYYRYMCSLSGQYYTVN